LGLLSWSSREPDKQSEASRTVPSPVAKFERPNISSPRFHVFRQDSKMPGLISVVVARNTTDEQLRSLLWLFRERVQAGRFKELGLKTRAEDSGIISIYRGDKYANEAFVSTGEYGEHDVAWYQWGIEGNPAKDDGD